MHLKLQTLQDLHKQPQQEILVLPKNDQRVVAVITAVAAAVAVVLVDPIQVQVTTEIILAPAAETVVVGPPSESIQVQVTMEMMAVPAVILVGMML